MISAAARMSLTRSSHGFADHAGYAAFAAAMALFAVVRSPLVKVPTSEPSIGVRFSNVAPSVIHLPFTKLP